MFRYLIVFIAACLLLGNTSLAQQHHKRTHKHFQVYHAPDQIYSYAWAGGMNSCQYNEIDINLDGLPDLLVFDRHGNRIMPFLNRGIIDSISYQYAPQLVKHFPALADWVIFRDYNLDGKADIFTYSPGFAGIKVYKNVSTTQLEFELVVFPFLTSFQIGGYTNILVTYADFPAIVDLDEDGDLDILTFWGLGSFVEYHENQSIEKYGTADSLDYIKQSICWGEFAESDESNALYLDTCFGVKGVVNKPWNRLPHTGSTFLVTDMNGDQVKDLVLGDVDYPDLYLLMNGGTSEDAYMISFTNVFPEATRRVYLYSMPVCSYLDVNNDGLNDLLVSAFDPSLVTSENYESSWLYFNEGQNDFPVFNFQSDQFLQDEMIDVGSGAYPALFDFTGDGLDDLIIGNFGYYDSSWYDQYVILRSSYTGKLAAFENIGSQNEPAYRLFDRNFLNISSQELKGLVPAFGDVDGDGKKDMLLGNQEGTLLFYKNTAATGQPPEFTLMDNKFQDIDVGEYSAPHLFDLNNDQIDDLVIGEKKGNLNYYEATGEPPYQYVWVTDSLGKVNVTDYNISYDGYSVPFFFRDQDQMLKLIVGSEQGKIFYFTHIENNLTGKFQESDSLFVLLDTTSMIFDEGLRSAGWIGDLNQDGKLDMIAGNYAGGLKIYAHDHPTVSPGTDEQTCRVTPDFRMYPNPAHGQVHIACTEHAQAVLYQVEIFSTLGQRIYIQDKINSGQIILDVSGINNGIYLVAVHFMNNQHTITKKIRKLVVSH